ncbi:hypothetical protein [Mycolicibacterium peregrinum]|uniref:hypothetical protein n=1 Tax=Mycolicibacterium peregrinum TaxID=43304 RepID=UPI003AAF8C09
MALVALVGCDSHAEPTLPPNTDPTTISERVNRADGPEFLRDVTSAAWPDDGQRAAELFAWIPRDAHSTDRTAATRAGQTAHAIASVLADHSDVPANTSANPVLWQAFARSLAPYVGAMVGDATGVEGFDSLDGPGSQMRRTAALFAAMTKDNDANQVLIDAASERAHTYEMAFAKAAVAEPILADRGAPQADLLRAAALRSLVATGAQLAEKGPTATPAHAQTELAYQVAVLTARPDDPHINDEFFSGGRLLPPSDIAESDWSIYDTQLTVYLTPWPRINDAIRQFGDAYDVIARGQ